MSGCTFNDAKQAAAEVCHNMTMAERARFPTVDKLDFPKTFGILVKQKKVELGKTKQDRTDIQIQNEIYRDFINNFITLTNRNIEALKIFERVNDVFIYSILICFFFNSLICIVQSSARADKNCRVREN